MTYVTFVTFIGYPPWPSVNFTIRLNDRFQSARSSTLLFLPELASGSAAVASSPGRSRKRQRWTARAAGGGGAG